MLLKRQVRIRRLVCMSRRVATTGRREWRQRTLQKCRTGEVGSRWPRRCIEGWRGTRCRDSNSIVRSFLPGQPLYAGFSLDCACVTRFRSAKDSYRPDYTPTKVRSLFTQALLQCLNGLGEIGSGRPLGREINTLLVRPPTLCARWLFTATADFSITAGLACRVPQCSTHDSLWNNVRGGVWAMCASKVDMYLQVW